MRLIRLTTNDSNCIFDETLNQDIRFEPNSTIALKNLTLEADTSLTIGPNNDNITYQLSNAVQVTAHLTHQTYTMQDPHGNDLVNNITRALNMALPVNGKSVGSQWNVSIPTATKNLVDIAYKQAPFSDLSSTPYD